MVLELVVPHSLMLNVFIKVLQHNLISTVVKQLEIQDTLSPDCNIHSVVSFNLVDD